MKNIALALTLTLFLAACSSGSSVSAVPPNDITGLYTGTFQSSNEMADGVVTINIQDNGGVLSGNLLLTFDPDQVNCIVNEVLTEGSSRVGFNVQLNTSQINLTLAVSDDARVLEGTYVPIGGGGCSNASGAGTIRLTR